MRQEMSQKSRLVNSKRTQTLGTFKNDSLEGEEVMVRAISFAKNMLIFNFLGSSFINFVFHNPCPLLYLEKGTSNFRNPTCLT